MIRAILGILGLGMTLTVTQVQASVTAPESAFQDLSRVVNGPGRQTIYYGPNGVRALVLRAPLVSSAGGALTVVKDISLPLPSGARLPVTATSKIPSAALATLLKKGLRLAPFLGTGVALYDMASELGFTVQKAGDGVAVTKPDPAVCTVAPCYRWEIGNGVYFPSSSALGLHHAGLLGAGWSFARYQQSDGRGYFNYTTSDGRVRPDYNSVVFYSSSVSPTPGAVVASSEQELADAIASKSGWPSGSAVAQALVDAQRLTGDQIPTDQPTVTGPATVVGPVEVSTTPYGDMVKKSTKASNYDCTYVQGATVMEGGSAICTEKTTTVDEITKTDPATGSKTTTTTTAEEATKPADIPKDEEEGQAFDSALPGQPSLYKRQYPDGLTGVWNTKKADLLATPLLQLTSNLQPTIASPGGYPIWPVPVVIGHWNFGTYDVSPASYVWDFLKVCTIIGALFLARALIFGG